jgi:hypothetical protein
MSFLRKKCCCGTGCWYHIPLCHCETDPEPCPLYILCEIADAFFDANPQYNNHLFFELFEKSVPDLTLCYDIIRDPIYITTTLPPNACILDDIPPPPPPDENDCAFCCTCCAPCFSGPITGCQEPICCYKLGDPATFNVQYPSTTSTHVCANDGVVYIVTCPPGNWTAQYEVIGCGKDEVVFGLVGGDTCLAPILIKSCCPQPGGLQCLCPLGPPNDQSCSCLCPVVDPCAIACSDNGATPCCQLCFSLGGICCLASFPDPSSHPCASIPAPDEPANTCKHFVRRIGTIYTKTSYEICNGGCFQQVSDSPSYTCGCRITTMTFDAEPSCFYNEDLGLCTEEPP